jgi:CDP-diacylglycerol--glycerol-3-phosphate 3-phosphatidyltransferase
MPTIYDVKPGFQALLRPLVRILARRGVTANQVTLAGVSLSLLTGAVVWSRPDLAAGLLLLPLVLLVRMALNAIDGLLAKEHDMKTPLGAVLNELGDVISDAAVYLPMARVPGVRAWLVVLVVFLALLSEMAGVVAVQIGASRRYDGPMGKSDRAFVFGVLYLLAGCGVGMGVWAQLILTLTVILLVLTIINRARLALREVTP